jgi:hypothetical protein
MLQEFVCETGLINVVFKIMDDRLYLVSIQYDTGTSSLVTTKLKLHGHNRCTTGFCDEAQKLTVTKLELSRIPPP